MPKPTLIFAEGEDVQFFPYGRNKKGEGLMKKANIEAVITPPGGVSLNNAKTTYNIKTDEGHSYTKVEAVYLDKWVELQEG